MGSEIVLPASRELAGTTCHPGGSRHIASPGQPPGGGANRTSAVALSGIADAAGRAFVVDHDSAVNVGAAGGDGSESTTEDVSAGASGATGVSTTTLDPSCAVCNSGTVRGLSLLVGINGAARYTVSVPHTTLSQSVERRTASTRRFSARPSAVAFDANGRNAPSLNQAIREESRPAWTKNRATPRALRSPRR